MEDEEKKKFDLNKIVENYGGAIIGGIVALILCFTKLYKLLIIAILIIAGAVIGNYVQKNKEVVKEKLKTFIDRF